MARSRYSSPSASTPQDETYQRQQGRRPTTRKSSSQPRSHQSDLSDSGMRSQYEDVTDVVLATEYYWSPVSRSQPQGRTMKQYDASAAMPYTPYTSSEMTSSLETSFARTVPRAVRRRDRKEGNDGLATPPRTPQLGRLSTPELESKGDCSKFCDCCSDEQRYREDRSKMDSQRRFTHTLFLLPGACRGACVASCCVVVWRSWQ